MQRLSLDITAGLEAGTLDEDKLDAFEFLWQTTPDTEKSGDAVRLHRAMGEMLDRFRRRHSATLSTLRYVDVTTGRPSSSSEECL